MAIARPGAIAPPFPQPVSVVRNLGLLRATVLAGRAGSGAPSRIVASYCVWGKPFGRGRLRSSRRRRRSIERARRVTGVDRCRVAACCVSAWSPPGTSQSPLAVDAGLVLRSERDARDGSAEECYRGSGCPYSGSRGRRFSALERHRSARHDFLRLRHDFRHVVVVVVVFDRSAKSVFVFCRA